MGVKSGGSGGYWRLKSGCSSRAGGCKTVAGAMEGGRKRLGRHRQSSPREGGGGGGNTPLKRRPHPLVQDQERVGPDGGRAEGYSSVILTWPKGTALTSALTAPFETGCTVRRRAARHGHCV